MLETAGFSSANPYYIVQQGKIQHLTVMQDQERIALIKEVAGTKVYEDRRAESVRLMEDSEARKHKIEQAVEELNKRLKELEGEKEELAKYREEDKKRRSIEYAMYDKDLNAARVSLEELEADRNESQSKRVALEEQSNAAVREKKEAEKELTILDRDNLDAVQELKRVADERKQLEKKRAKLQLQLNDLSSQADKDETAKTSIEKELNEVKANKATLQKQIDRKKHDLKQAKYREGSSRSELSKQEARLRDLHSKKGRASEFKTQADRDKYLTQQIKGHEATLEDMKKQTKRLQNENKELKQKSDSTGGDLKKHEDKVKAITKQIEETDKKREALTEQRNTHLTKQKVLWSQHHKLERDVQMIRKEKDQAERKVEKSMSRDMKQGLDAVKNVVAKHKIGGVHGPVVELISCQTVYNTAVEVTAGNALLHVVVRDDNVASDILAAMNREKLEGRVTFMPLNRLKADWSVPMATEDVLPLVEKLEFAPEYAPAIHSIFGRTMLASSLEKANEYSRASNLDCITLEGDKVDRRGAMTGGYLDTKASRIEAVVNLRSVVAKYHETKQAMLQIETELRGLDQTITIAVGDIEKQKAAAEQLKRQLNQERLDMRTLREAGDNTRSTMADTTKAFEEMQLSMTEVEDAIRALQGELSTQMKSQLTDPEEAELAHLSASVAELKSTHAEAQAAAIRLEADVAADSDKMANHLAKREAYLETELDRLRGAGTETDRREQMVELQSVETQLNNLEKQAATLEKENSRYLMKKQALAGKIEKLQVTQQELTKQLQDLQQRANTFLSDKSLQVMKRDEAVKKIRNLGTMPSDAATYQTWETKKLINQLHKTNETLKGYMHVNKKALEQYTQLVESRDTLEDKKNELAREGAEIHNLIQHLDNKKDEAILRTFRQVKHEFSNIFKQLVQIKGDEAVAELEMVRAADLVEKKKRNTLSQDTVDMFTGVRISVSFGVGGRTMQMERLSGGQKSLVALALIFAIQRCDPAPFYLFDEIDAALDAQYRSAVALMIKEQSANAQFITATFKTELVEVADKHYGIIFKNKVSHIRKISEQQAEQILIDAAADVKKRKRGDDETA
uniref:SMC hinge domain-containing protein n=1 Tax=Eutreptiella gymnastica TaxID=73025 RepID=A0A7S1N2S4_9EUGL